VVAVADSVAAADLVEAADLVAAAASTEAVAGVVAMDAATVVVMASTVVRWLSDPVAGGTPTAFASAGIIDTGLIGVTSRAIVNKKWVCRATGTLFFYLAVCSD
jgi:hypothetical protein